MSINRRTMQEQIGIAVNASGLRIESREPGAETSLLRVASLGAAILHVKHGADRVGPLGHGGPVCEVLADPQHAPRELDQLSGELGGLLWHIRYGRQHGRVHQAIALFAAYVARRERFMQAKHLAQLSEARRSEILELFSARVMHEWLSDRCIACGGSGKLERTESGSWVRPRGRMARNATFRGCDACHGSGQSMPSHTARRKILGLTIDDYDAQGWAQNFRAALTWLDAIARRLRRPLTVQLERAIRRT